MVGEKREREGADSNPPGPAKVPRTAAADAAPAEATPEPFSSTRAPLDDLTSAVVRLVGEACKMPSSPEVEVEARLGLLNDKYAGGRICPPWAASAFVLRDANVVFDASVPNAAFVRVNQMLNKMIEAQGAQRQGQYRKSLTLDLFEERRTQSGPVSNRHTVDPETYMPVASVAKARKAAFDVYSPCQAFDLRFICATETAVKMPVSVAEYIEHVKRVRHKERRSYKLDCFVVELTTATEYAVPEGSPLQSLKELETLEKVVKMEIEIELDMQVFRKAHAAAAASGSGDAAKGRFIRLCRTFYDNIRLLSEVASG